VDVVVTEVVVINLSIDVHQNLYLAPGETEMNALLRVRSAAGPGAAGPPRVAVVIIVDCSGSMSAPPVKVFAAKEAANAAIETLREGTLFAVVAGRDSARSVYPKTGLATVSAESRAAARDAVGRLRARGGTAMSTWLAAANSLLGAHPGAICHAILLTDGQNGESREKLRAVLEECDGRFRCDCRGIGDDWVADDLATIASRLLGAARPVERLTDLADDFRAIAAEVMRQVVGEASLRLWIPFGARVIFFKQVYPTINDLTDRSVRVDPNTLAYPTGAWGTEERHYHLSIGDLKPITAEKPSRVGAVRFVLDGEKSDGAVILARWTDDWMLFTQTSRAEAEAAGQVELALAIQLGTAALGDGDEDDAVGHLGRAARIAFQAGDRAKLDLLARLVEIEDAAAGVVRLRSGLGRGLVEGVSLGSYWTRNVESDTESESHTGFESETESETDTDAGAGRSAR
jgi:hypothetical protein